MNTLILLSGYTGVGKSLFLSEAQKYEVSSLHLRRMWESIHSNNRFLSEKAFFEIAEKTGDRNGWLNVLLPNIEKIIQISDIFIFEGVSAVSELDWIQRNIVSKRIISIYIYTTCFEKRCELVSKRERVSLEEAKKIIFRSDINRSILGMKEIQDRAQFKIENKYNNSFLIKIKEILTELQ